MTRSEALASLSRDRDQALAVAPSLRLVNERNASLVRQAFRD